MASKKVEMYAKKRYELDEIKNKISGTGVRQPGCPQEMGDGRRTRHQDADGRGLQGQVRYCPGG